MGKHNKQGRKEKHKEKQYHEDVERVENAYNFIERRQIIGGGKILLGKCPIYYIF